jgi:hypothetical protein
VEVAGAGVAGWAASVRYIDWGNFETGVLASDLFAWDPVLELVPAQAALCRLPACGTATLRPGSFSGEELAAFRSLLVGSGPFQLVVCCRLQAPGWLLRPDSDSSVPELEVALLPRRGQHTLLELLGQHTLLGRLFPPALAASPAPAWELPPPLPLPAPRPPHPTHLEGEELLGPELPSSPVPPGLLTQALNNVTWWLENKYDDQAGSRDSFPETQPEGTPENWLEPHFQEEPRLEVHVRQSRDRTATIIETFNKAEKERGGSEGENNGEEEYLAPRLGQQAAELEEGEDGWKEFPWLLGHLASPGEVWVQPVQDLTTRLQDIEAAMAALPLRPSRESGVEPGSCWAVRRPAALLPATLCSAAWLRVRVEAVEAAGRAYSLRSIDYGARVVVEAAALHRLPPGPPSTLPGLAVRCHLAHIAPCQGERWSEAATAAVGQLLDPAQVHSALVVEGEGPGAESLGVLVVLEPAGRGEPHAIVNRRLVELGLASSHVFVDEEDSGVAVERSFDPMVQVFTTITNNYLTNDDDLQVATHGYRARLGVCPFYLNRDGHCYKGAYCQDRHQQPREGAVTTDQEEVLLAARAPFLLRPNTVQKRVLLAHIISPSRFYLTFPNGTQDASLLSATDLARSISPRHANFQASITAFYEDSRKRLMLGSLPAPGSLLVVKAAGAWHRATVLEGSQGGGDALQQVFLVDEGRMASVHLNDIRQMEPSFSTFPQQALLSCLEGMEPVGDTWCPDSTRYFAELAGSGPLTARIVAYDETELLVVQVEVGAALRANHPSLQLTVGRAGAELPVGRLLLERGWARRAAGPASREPPRVAYCPG